MKAKDSEMRAIPRIGITMSREKAANLVNPSAVQKSMIIELMELKNETLHGIGCMLFLVLHLEQQNMLLLKQ